VNAVQSCIGFPKPCNDFMNSILSLLEFHRYIFLASNGHLSQLSLLSPFRFDSITSRLSILLERSEHFAAHLSFLTE